MAVTPVITEEEVRPHLAGLTPWFRAAAASEEKYDTARMEKKVFPAVVRNFERDCHFRVNQVQVVSLPDGQYAPIGARTGDMALDGTHELKVDQPYPFYMQDAQEYFNVTLYERPVSKVQRLRFMWNSTALIYQPNAEWLQWNDKSGELWIMPYSGSGFVGSAALAFSQLTYMFGAMPYVPNIQVIDYIAGLQDGWQNSREWSDLRMGLEEECALQCLLDLDEMFDAGMVGKTISYMGETQTVNYDKFQNKIGRLQKKQQTFRALMSGTQSPVQMVVI